MNYTNLFIKNFFGVHCGKINKFLFTRQQMNQKESFLKHFLDATLQGLFWILPITAIIMLVLWLYKIVASIASKIFAIIGFSPEKYEYLWVFLVLSICILLMFLLGLLMESKITKLFDVIFSKIPGYSTIKDLVNIFNSSKKGDKKVLVVLIKGFGSVGFNVGLMYSQVQSVVKDHYTVTLSQTPIPNGGYMFEVHKENIFVINEATFDNNLQYLLSMGVKSLADITKIEPKDIKDFMTLDEWLSRKII